MTKSVQFEIIFEILKRFQAAGVLDKLVLVGSWCLYFYRYGSALLGGLPTPRTTDIDFLVPRPFRFEKVTDVPAILEELGFAPTFHGMSGLAVYDHPELRLEFLVPEIGRGSSEPVAIRGLQVKAQGIRYLNFLSSCDNNYIS
ncbi:MAG: GSU2403 family nucleotidyltransferase fold protein [Candidatus Omnitrophota bacterium]